MRPLTVQAMVTTAPAAPGPEPPRPGALVELVRRYTTLTELGDHGTLRGDVPVLPITDVPCPADPRRGHLLLPQLRGRRRRPDLRGQGRPPLLTSNYPSRSCGTPRPRLAGSRTAAIRVLAASRPGGGTCPSASRRWSARGAGAARVRRHGESTGTARRDPGCEPKSARTSRARPPAQRRANARRFCTCAITGYSRPPISSCNQRLSRVVRLTVDDVIRDGDQVLLRLGEPASPVPAPFAELLLEWIDKRDNMNTATNPNSRWLFPGRRAGQPMNSDWLAALVNDLGIPTTTVRTSAIRQHVLDMPAPVVADALGYHQATATRIATQAGATWSRYAPGDHSRSQPRRTCDS